MKTNRSMSDSKEEFDMQPYTKKELAYFIGNLVEKLKTVKKRIAANDSLLERLQKKTKKLEKKTHDRTNQLIESTKLIDAALERRQGQIHEKQVLDRHINTLQNLHAHGQPSKAPEPLVEIS